MSKIEDLVSSLYPIACAGQLPPDVVRVFQGMLIEYTLKKAREGLVIGETVYQINYRKIPGVHSHWCQYCTEVIWLSILVKVI